jgi:hypothetical protein
VRIALALIAVLLAAGCASPREPAKQAEEIHSIAAEGALLAHEVAEGSTTDTFARQHARALRKLLEELQPAIENPELAQLAAKVRELLTVLAERPGDRELGARFERVLESHAESASELAR